MRPRSGVVKRWGEKRAKLANLLLLCDMHHRLVHEGHWRLDGTAFDFDVFRPDGSLFDHITRAPP